jgi:hypothetical protein
MLFVSAVETLMSPRGMALNSVDVVAGLWNETRLASRAAVGEKMDDCAVMDDPEDLEEWPEE